jgi:hypothetical protein
MIVRVIIFIFFLMYATGYTFQISGYDGEYGLNYTKFKELFIKKYSKSVAELTKTIIVDCDVNFNGIESAGNFINRRIYINKDDFPDNDFDDDKDGFINNTYGLNLISNNNDPFSIFTDLYSDNLNDGFHEENKHGFYMLQIVDKITISPLVKIYPISVNTVEDFARAVDWVVNEKSKGVNIKIVNLPATSFLKLHLYNNKLVFNEIKRYVKKLDDAGMILVVGAGNHPPVDSNPFALIGLKNVLSVAVHDRNGNVIYKHDKRYVDFTVPAVFGLGTSEGSSIASAIIATYYSIRGNVSYQRMLDFIKASIKKDKNFNEFTKFGGFLQYNENILSY